MNKLTIIIVPFSTFLSPLDTVKCETRQPHNDSHAPEESYKSITFHCRQPPATTALQLCLNPLNQDEFKVFFGIFPPLLYFIFCTSFFTTVLIIPLKECCRLPLEIPKTPESQRRLSSLIPCPCSIGCTEFLFLHLKDLHFTSRSQEHSSVLRQTNPLCLRYVRYNQPQEALK